MTESYMFTKLLPKNVAFVRGESVSPDKLNGIFNQLSSACYVLESFLGNGVDYRISEESDRKMIFNLSTAIGRTDKLYKPINKIPDLERIANKYAGDYGSYNSLTEEFTLTDKIVIPAEIISGNKLAIYYTGQPIITIGASGFTFEEKTSYGWGYIDNIDTTIDYFYIEPNTGKTLVIKSLYISTKENDGESYNIGYSTPLSNANYYTVKVPCMYSNPSLIDQSQICASKTCNYCIGNTYDLNASNTATYGSPICSGAIAEDATPLSYMAESANDRASYLTLQCPVNTTDNTYSIKYRPFKMHDTALDDKLIVNMCMIYDVKDQVTAMKYNVPLYSAGGIGANIRGDICYIKDNISIQSGDSQRYIVIGGNYGIIDLLYDMITFVERQIPVGIQLLGPAVYDD